MLISETMKEKDRSGEIEAASLAENTLKTDTNIIHQEADIVKPRDALRGRD